MLFETYGMIVPEKGTCPNYELFYMFYSLNIKQNLLANHLFNEVKSQLPVMSLEIKESINHKLQEIDSILPAMGLKREKTEREEYNISILNDDLYLRRKYFDGNYEEFINYITNIQQLITLYSSFENTIKSYLITQGKNADERVFQKKLLDEVCSINHKFISKFNDLYKNFTQNDFTVIWKYFTFIRNLYTHSSGVIDNDFIKEMDKIKNKITDMINRNFEFIERNLFPNNYNILRTDNFIENDLFIITEIELRFFRNFIIYVWEAIYLSHYNLSKKNYVSSHIKFNLEHNQFKFHLIQTHDESEALNRMQTFYTKKMSNFYISTYVCPNCTKEPVVLYKTLYHPNISLMKITQQEEHKDINMERVFTCSHCRSFFISKYKERLSDNNGNNLLNLNDDDYLLILEQFNIEGTPYPPNSEENIESELNLTMQINQLETLLNDLKNNRKKY